MNAPVATNVLLTAEAAARDEELLLDVLCSSLYPGAARESARMVVAYCRAAQLDPLQKPVHIVPMSVKTGMKNGYGNDEYVTRDVVMPGIGLYRIQAARTGQYAGQDEPDIGPMRTTTISGTKREWVTVPGKDKKQPRDTSYEKTIEYPEWVKVTVYRLVGGFRCAFTAKEFWMENYATAGRDNDTPNAMWSRRVIGQLVKCAEAQALRKGFPEVGSQPTAEEMEGRAFEVEPAEEAPQAPVMPRRASETQQALPDATAEQAEARAIVPDVAAAKPEPAAVVAGNVATPPAQAAAAPVGEPATEGERKNVLITAKARKADLPALLAELGFGVPPDTLDGLTKPQFKAIKARLQ